MVFSGSGMQACCGQQRHKCWWKAWARRRQAAGPVVLVLVLVLPLVIQAVVGVLSLSVRMVFLHTSWSWHLMSCWAADMAGSRSELVTQLHVLILTRTKITAESE